MNTITRQETNERLRALHEAIGAHMPGWQVKRVPEEFEPWYPYYLENAAGETIEIETDDRYHVPKGKAHISTHRWPKTAEGNTVSPHDVRMDSPSINIALDKGPEKIAREIERRFLPAYREVLKAINARIAERDAFRNGQNAVRARIDETGLVRWWNDRNGGDGTTANLDFQGVEGYGDIQINSGSSVTLKLYSIRPALALRILEQIAADKVEG